MDLPLEGGFDDVVVEGKWRSGAGGVRGEDAPGSAILPSIVLFVVCGDLSGYVAPEGSFGYLDADKSYPLEEDRTDMPLKRKDQSKSNRVGAKDGKNDYVQPIAPLIKPPYETSMEKAKDYRHLSTRQRFYLTCYP